MTAWGVIVAWFMWNVVAPAIWLLMILGGIAIILHFVGRNEPPSEP